MKNTLIVISIILIFIILYFLQLNFFSWFNIGGVQPNLFILLVLFIGLFAGKRIGIPIGIFLGISLDLLNAQKIGITGIMLGIIGAAGGILDKNFSKDSRITILLMTIGVTFIYEFGLYIINYFAISSALELIPFIKIVLIEILYNVILTIILHPLIQKAGYYMEDTFREKRILTRYF